MLEEKQSFWNYLWNKKPDIVDYIASPVYGLLEFATTINLITDEYQGMAICLSCLGFLGLTKLNNLHREFIISEFGESTKGLVERAETVGESLNSKFQNLFNKLDSKLFWRIKG